MYVDFFLVKMYPCLCCTCHPEAKIKEHSNDEYSENYEEVDGNCIEICNKGESHFLENSSTDKWLVIFVVKRK